MATEFRIGIVGTGLIVQESHLPACLAAPGVRVAALVDTAPGRAEECVRRFGLSSRVLERVPDLQGLVDGVIIATPDPSHAELAVQCLEAGLGVLIEKPLAPTIAECERIADAGARTGATVAVGYCLRFWPSVELVGELVQTGAFGAPRRFLMQTGSPGGWSPLSAYYLRQARGGAMSINGSHYLERALHWFGEPAEVLFEDDSDGGPEANARAELRYPGITGVVRVSRTTKLNSGSSIETDRGILVHRDWQSPTVEFIPHGHLGEPFSIAKGECSMAGRPDPYRRQVEDFVESCRTRRRPRVDVHQGLAVTRLINALYSCRTKMDEDWYRSAGAGGAR
jgi:predicted dehydrogenase